PAAQDELQILKLSLSFLGGLEGGSGAGGHGRSPSLVGKSHPEVEGKLAEAADRYKSFARDPSCYEHAFPSSSSPTRTWSLSRRRKPSGSRATYARQSSRP